MHPGDLEHYCLKGRKSKKETREFTSEFLKSFYIISYSLFSFMMCLLVSLLFIDDLAFFDLKRYVLWSIVEVSEPSLFEENKNNRCSVTCPGLQPLEHKFDSLACSDYDA